MDWIVELIALKSLAAFSIKGSEARKFLQGQLTCDLNQLKPNCTLRGAHCNKEGRVIALYDLFQYEDKIILITQRALLAEAMAVLKHYAMFSKLEWQDLSKNYQIFACLGGRLPSMQVFPLSAALPGPIERYLFLQQETEGGVTANTEEASWYYQCLLLKEAFLNPRTVGKFLPQELGMSGAALSFTKGCYLGQEVIARVHYRGKLKRRLRLIVSEQYLEPLQEIFSEAKAVAEVVASIQYQGRCYLLALVDNTCQQLSGLLE